MAKGERVARDMLGCGITTQDSREDIRGFVGSVDRSDIRRPNVPQWFMGWRIGDGRKVDGKGDVAGDPIRNPSRMSVK